MNFVLSLYIDYSLYNLYNNNNNNKCHKKEYQEERHKFPSANRLLNTYSRTRNQKCRWSRKTFSFKMMSSIVFALRSPICNQLGKGPNPQQNLIMERTVILANLVNVAPTRCIWVIRVQIPYIQTKQLHHHPDHCTGIYPDLPVFTPVFTQGNNRHLQLPW